MTNQAKCAENQFNMSKKIVFKIDKEGNVKIDEITGFGSECKNFTELLENSLGTTDEASRVFTDEYQGSIEIDNQNNDHLHL